MNISEKNKKEFRVRIVSDLDYEEMVADICWGTDTVALVSREKGIDKMEIELFSPPKGTSWKFSLNDFAEAIQLAKESIEK